MEKKYLITAVFVLLFPAAARAQAPEESGAVAASTSVVTGLNLDYSASAPAFGQFAATAAAAGLSQAASTVPKRAAPVKVEKKMRELISLIEAEPKRAIKQVAVYKGDSDTKKTYKLNFPKGAHWRLLWKFDILPKAGKASLKLELKSASDQQYLQGITKDINQADQSAFGVINCCLLTGGEFTMTLDVSSARWEIEVQQLQ